MIPDKIGGFDFFYEIKWIIKRGDFIKLIYHDSDILSDKSREVK